MAVTVVPFSFRKFFRNLDPAVADAVKSQKNLADW